MKKKKKKRRRRWNGAATRMAFTFESESIRYLKHQSQGCSPSFDRVTS